jgi:hypothetical protein
MRPHVAPHVPTPPALTRMTDGPNPEDSLSPPLSRVYNAESTRRC